jgi:hypothetical protein
VLKAQNTGGRFSLDCNTQESWRIAPSATWYRLFRFRLLIVNLGRFHLKISIKLLIQH